MAISKMSGDPGEPKRIPRLVGKGTLQVDDYHFWEDDSGYPVFTRRGSIADMEWYRGHCWYIQPYAPDIEEVSAADQEGAGGEQVPTDTISGYPI